jgi:hypothetical protein
VAGDLQSQVSPSPESPETAGRAVQQGLQQQIEMHGQAAEQGYERAWAGRGQKQFTHVVPLRVDPDGSIIRGEVNMPVDVRDIKDSAEPLRQEMEWALSHSEQSQSRAYNVLEKLVNGDDFVPAWQAERALSALKDMARVKSASGVKDTAQGTAAFLVPQLQENIDAAVAATGKDALQGLQQGRAQHASKMEVAEVADQLRKEPVQAFGQLTWQEDTGVDFLRKIKQYAPQTLPKIGRAYVQQLFDEAAREGGFQRARTVLNQWEKLGPETKKLLYGDPKLISSLDNLFRGAEIVSRRPNPSGTALVQSATSTNPMRWVAGWLGSKAFFTPKYIDLLTERLTRGQRPGNTPPSGGSAPPNPKQGGGAPDSAAGNQRGSWSNTELGPHGPIYRQF